MTDQRLPRIVAALAMAAAVALAAAPTVAQDDAASTGDGVGIFVPETVAGRTLEVTAIPGEAMLAGVDADDPEQAQQAADLLALLDELGVTPEQMDVVSAFAADDEGNVVIIGVRLEGGDSAVFIEPWIRMLAAAQYDEPELASGELDGRSVLILTDADYPLEDPPKSFGYGLGDTVWLVGGTEEWATEVIAALPG